MNLQRIYQHNTPGRLIFGPKSINELAKEIPAKEIPLRHHGPRGFQIANSQEGHSRFGGGGNPLPYF